MARNNKLAQHLKKMIKATKRLNNIRIHHKGSVSQRVKKRNGDDHFFFEVEQINLENIEHHISSR